MLNDQVRNSTTGKPFWHKIIIRKFSAPIVIAFAVIISLAAAFMIAREGYVLGIILICALVGLPILYATVVYPEFGIVTLIVVSFFINFASRFLPRADSYRPGNGRTYLAAHFRFFCQKKK